MIDVGLNWYLNKFVKVYFDWEHAIFALPGLRREPPERPYRLPTSNDLFWRGCNSTIDLTCYRPGLQVEHKDRDTN